MRRTLRNITVETVHAARYTRMIMNFPADATIGSGDEHLFESGKLRVQSHRRRGAFAFAFISYLIEMFVAGGKGKYQYWK